MQSNNPVNLLVVSVDLYICLSLSIRIFLRCEWQPMFLLVASNFYSSYLSLPEYWMAKTQVVPQKEWLKREALNPKSCTKKDQNWHVVQSPNLAREIVQNCPIYTLFISACKGNNFPLAILLDWRVVGFSHCFSPVKWVVWQQQQRMESSSVQNPSKSFVIPFNWLVNRDCHDGQFLSLLNRVAYNPSIQLVNKDLGHCFKYCQLEVGAYWKSEPGYLCPKPPPSKLGTPGTPQTWDSPTLYHYGHYCMSTCQPSTAILGCGTLPRLPLPRPPGHRPHPQPRNNSVTRVFRLSIASMASMAKYLSM